MTIVECVNEKTALNLNPFQVFVFLNQRTKRFENRLDDFDCLNLNYLYY